MDRRISPGWLLMVFGLFSTLGIYLMKRHYGEIYRTPDKVTFGVGCLLVVIGLYMILTYDRKKEDAEAQSAGRDLVSGQVVISKAPVLIPQFAPSDGNLLVRFMNRAKLSTPVIFTLHPNRSFSFSRKADNSLKNTFYFFLFSLVVAAVGLLSHRLTSLNAVVIALFFLLQQLRRYGRRDVVVISETELVIYKTCYFGYQLQRLPRSHVLRIETPFGFTDENSSLDFPGKKGREANLIYKDLQGNENALWLGSYPLKEAAEELRMQLSRHLWS